MLLPGSSKWGKYLVVAETDIFIVKQPLESLISGETAEDLGIISFHVGSKELVNVLKEVDEILQPENENKLPTSDDPIINSYLQKFHKRFEGIGKCDKVVTLHQNEKPKPFIQPQRPIPFHLRKQFDSYCDKLIEQGIFEESEGPSEWISNPVIVTKPEGGTRITVDYRKLNKSLLNSHHPIPRMDANILANWISDRHTFNFH